MLITYFILIVIAIIFKLFHWPGTSLIFLISPLFPLIDILIQAIRKNENKSLRVLSAIGVFLLSVFILFKFLHWPGSNLLFWITFPILAVFVFLLIKKKPKHTIRFYIATLLFLFGVINFSIKGSDFRLAYLLEDPFNPSEPVPHFFIQSLAYDYYLEGDYDKAEVLILRNIDHITDLINQKNVPDYLHQIDQENLEISQKDLYAIRNRSWNYFEPLYREDRPN